MNIKKIEFINNSRYILLTIAVHNDDTYTMLTYYPPYYMVFNTLINSHDNIIVYHYVRTVPNNCYL